MIDLDEQLTAYSRYLDDVERPLVPLDGPVAADPPERTSRRRFLSMSAAAAVAIAGGAVIARVATRGDGSGSSNLAPLDPDWRLVPDPDGLFLPAPMLDDMIEDAEPNSIEIKAVADTSFGLIAVGSELRHLIRYNAMWRSDDAVTWERLPNDDDFGPTDFTGANARILTNLVEFDGRLVGSDGANFWRTDDLEHWESTDIPIASPRAEASGFLAAALSSGPAGVVAAGSGLLFSPDAVEWQVIDGYANVATLFGGGAAYIGDQFVVAGSGSRAMVVTSSDGLAWTPTELPDSGSAVPFAVAGTEDTLVVLGAAPGEETDEGWTQAVAWTSTDHGSTWTRTELGGIHRDGVYPTILVHVGGEFVAIAARFGDGGTENVHYRSPDGLEWTEHSVDLPGFRWGATAFGGGAVAVGSAGWMLGMGSTPTSILPPDDPTDPRHAASIWALGL